MELKVKKVQEIAQKWEINSIVEELEKLNKMFGEDGLPIRIALVGEFSAGKTSLLNAILGQELFKVGLLPTTSYMVEVHFSNEKKAELIFRNGSKEELPWEKVKEYGGDESLEKMNVYFPISDLPKNVSLVDLPGMAAERLHDRLTLEAIQSSDIILMVVDAKKGIVSREFLLLLKDADLMKKDIYLVLNKIDLLEDNEIPLVKEKIESLISKKFEHYAGCYLVESANPKDAKIEDILNWLKNISNSYEEKQMLKIKDMFKKKVLMLTRYLEEKIDIIKSDSRVIEERLEELKKNREILKEKINEDVLFLKDKLWSKIKEAGSNFRDKLEKKKGYLVDKIFTPGVVAEEVQQEFDFITKEIAQEIFSDLEKDFENIVKHFDFKALEKIDINRLEYVALIKETLLIFVMDFLLPGGLGTAMIARILIKIFGEDFFKAILSALEQIPILKDLGKKVLELVFKKEITSQVEKAFDDAAELFKNMLEKEFKNNFEILEKEIINKYKEKMDEQQKMLEEAISKKEELESKLEEIRGDITYLDSLV